MPRQQTFERSVAARRSARPLVPVASKAFYSWIELAGAPKPFASNVEIYGENEPAEYVSKILTGAVRTCKVLYDGRRQIVDFHFPGDVFGLESGDGHPFSAEAVTDCKILGIKRSALASLAGRDTDVARQLWAMTAKELQRAQDHNMLLIKSAQQRVAGFLLEMAKRSAVRSEIELPMSRRDIGDYLGLTLETVSRTLSQLQKDGAIAVPSFRRVVLRNRAALARLNI
jgi:CRP/FNR family nitrogen fixation transcriptional regulator